MKLNKQGRDELRTQIEEQLKRVPDGQRIHLDKELLEELLFETISDDNVIVKLPFWSGKFLSKIDLNDIDFENVSWTLLSSYGEDVFFENDNLNKKFYLLWEEIKHKRKNDYYVDYSNTNAKIDFNKASRIGIADDEKTGILGVNFSGVDFSNLDINDFEFVWQSDLSNTNINFSCLDSRKETFLSFTSLENVDLSKITVDITVFWGDDIPFNDCNLKNTKLNIVCKPDELKSQFIEDIPCYLGEISKLIKEGKLDGCYINGKLIHSKEERQQIAQQKRQEYIDSIKNDVISSIDEQISDIKK